MLITVGMSYQQQHSSPSPLSRILASLFSPAVILSLQLLIVGIIVAMLISCIRVDYDSIVVNLFADCFG